jgi:tRNA G18 (ribose-2'-O)-methylase SpoU
MAIVIRIENLDDPRLAIYRNLKATNETRDLDWFVVEGLKLVIRLSASRYPVVSVVCLERQLGGLVEGLAPEVPVYVLPTESITRLVGYNFHQGAIAAARRVPPDPLRDVLAARPHDATLLICPRVDNPENLGALIRLSDVFDVAAMLVGPKSPDPLSRRVLRVSMGTALRVPVIEPSDLPETVGWLTQAHGFECWAIEADATAEPLDGATRPPRVAYLFGSESAGLTPDWRGLCSRVATIPMRPGADSLNLAVAAGILLHQDWRQRNLSAPA